MPFAYIGRQYGHEWRLGYRRDHQRSMSRLLDPRKHAELFQGLEPQVVLDSRANAIEISGAPNLDLIEQPWMEDERDPTQPWEMDVVAVQSITLEAPDQKDFDQRMGLRSKKYLTILRASDAQWIVRRVQEAITGKVVVELGAGVGVMSTALAAHAARVYAIEADPMWSFVFARHLYKNKPANLTYILDNAASLVGTIKADVAICVTGSDEVNLRALCEQFAPTVFMPWQDWNGGKAVLRGGSPADNARGAR